MQPLTLKTNLAEHPISAPLISGQLRSPLVAFDFCGPPVANAGFKPMVRDGRFDCGELAIGTFLQAREYGKPLVLLPITVMARFQHGHIECNTASGRTTPNAIEGGRVGIRSYTQTTGIWVRGILQHEYGVDLEKVQWVCTDDAHLAEYSDPPWVARVRRRSDEIERMLLDGELDAAIVNGQLSKHPGIQPLIADPKRAARDWHAKHGVVPINHMMVVREELVRARPDVVREIWRLFQESKATLATGPDGIDMLPLGIEACRPALALMIEYALEQRIISTRPSLDDMFGEFAALQ